MWNLHFRVLFSPIFRVPAAPSPWNNQTFSYNPGLGGIKSLFSVFAEDQFDSSCVIFFPVRCSLWGGRGGVKLQTYTRTTSEIPDPCCNQRISITFYHQHPKQLFVPTEKSEWSRSSICSESFLVFTGFYTHAHATPLTNWNLKHL